MPDPPVSSRGAGAPEHALTNRIVGAFLYSNLSLILIVLAAGVGLAALLVTAREAEPQIVVPMADVHVSFPGHAAAELEQLVASPLERLLYQIDGVEYVYSMSRRDHAVITVRFYVGEDRERSLVKINKKIAENIDAVPPGVTGWVVKPVEIDDVPIVTLTLGSATSNEYVLRRIAEEMVVRLAAVPDISRAYVIGGQPRQMHVYLDPDRLQAYGLDPLTVEAAIRAANVTRTAGQFKRSDAVVRVEAGSAFEDAEQLRQLVVGVWSARPVLLKDVADVVDGPAEADSYVRHGWGPSRDVGHHPASPGSPIGPRAVAAGSDGQPTPAVTIALAKKKGANAVRVAERIVDAADQLKSDVVPDDVEVVVTRNQGLDSNEKVNELIEALIVALIFVFAVLSLGLGWRESLIVAVAVPVVFGLTLAVNYVAGFTINRVTLFALILALGLLVDDPIVDVENIARHFRLRRKATRRIVIEAIAEIRPPLITATLAVIVSFLPMAFITGMMGPYMRPMALNVPVAMIVSMLVAFTITPWLAFHMLKRRYSVQQTPTGAVDGSSDPHEVGRVEDTTLYKLFRPLMSPLLRRRSAAWAFLAVVAVLTVLAAGLAVTRHVPLKMLPFGNNDQLHLLLDFDEGTTLERNDAVVRRIEQYLATVPEVRDFSAYVGLAGPMDFNAMVRHYYLRRGDHVADVQVNLVSKHQRADQTHAIALRLRDDLTAIAAAGDATLQIVEAPPGPPVLASVVAEVYGPADQQYDDLIAAAGAVRARMQREPGLVDIDDTVEAKQSKLIFVTDKEKAALNGLTVHDIARTLGMALAGQPVGIVQMPDQRQPLNIVLRLRRPLRSSARDLSRLHVRGRDGQLVPLAELGQWKQTVIDQTIYHKNLQPVVYVFAETAGRPPADCVVDMTADRAELAADSGLDVQTAGSGWVENAPPRHVDDRTFANNGSDVRWAVPDGIGVEFAGEGEWDLTLRVFRDLGIAFAAALVGIYILLVAQMRSFSIPVIVMLAIPLTIIGIMPGFWLLNVIVGDAAGGYADPIFFTATGMIGMIALAGIVTRQSVIIVDFVHLLLRQGRPLFDAVIESCVVRLRPILLTAGTAMLSAVPIATDPVFSGLAWALIFGLLASTAFTLFVVPVTYYLIYRNVPHHGAAPVTDAPS